MNLRYISRSRFSCYISQARKYSNLIMASLLRKATKKSYPGFEKEKESAWNGPFFFIQGSDPQFGMMDTYVKRKPVVTWDEEMELAEKCVKAINDMTPKPKFFIICGDLIHAMPGEPYRNAQEEDFIKVFKELHPDIPLICVCGNHDVGNTPTPSAVQGYRGKFGDDYFSFYCSGVMFIVLNSQYYEDPSLVQDFAQEQDTWLDEQLKEAEIGKYKHVIVFQHIPWFLSDPEEEKVYFNINLELRRKMLQKFYNAGVRAVFCGHYHRNAGGFYKDLELVVTSAIGCQLGTDKSGFRVVKLNETSIRHEYHTLEEVPKTITFE